MKDIWVFKTDTITSEVLKNCQKCQLHGDGYALSRIHKGSGKKVMFIGEAPGAEEAEHHLAFVGRSGKLLDHWISLLGIDNYVITNVVRHRPITEEGKNRTPTEYEILSCLPYLSHEVVNELPDFLILLGRTPLKTIKKFVDKNFVGLDVPMYSIAQTIKFSLKNDMRTVDGLGNRIRTFVLYHPSYVLRNHNESEIAEYLLPMRLKIHA